MSSIVEIAKELGIKVTSAHPDSQVYECWWDRVRAAEYRASDLECALDLGCGESRVAGCRAELAEAVAQANAYAI